MTSSEDRRWYSLPLQTANESVSSENTAVFRFISTAVNRGFTPYSQNNELELGAINGFGRECLIVCRGKQRAEAILLQNGEATTRQVFTSLVAGEAFEQAAAISLDWLSESNIQTTP